jgi:hypothetical protein
MKVGIIIGIMMKRFVSILLAVTAIPVFAQLNGDGYYRVQNVQSGNYTTIVDNQGEKPSVHTSNIDAYAINTVHGFENVVSDPGSIIYIEKRSQGYVLKGQGMDTYQLTGYYLQIPASRTTENAYWASGVYSGVTKYLYEAYNKSFAFGYLTTASKNSDGSARNRDWYILPVTNKDGQYFGLAPELKIGDKYYTTLYVSFPFHVLSDGMKVYYVKQHCTETQLGPIAEMVEIKDGTVPGGVPVIIESNSNLPANNKITPLTTSVANDLQNELKGVYFCNVIKWATGRLYPEHKNWNTTAYDPATMRVLGEVNGKLGFVKSDDLEYLPANKAYLPITEEEATMAVSSNVLLVNSATYSTYSAGIENITAEEVVKNKGVYTLMGTKVREDQSTDNLPSGIYIVNGKKVIEK